ncbi:MAG: aspartyl protease family protein [Thermoprotei archaeon]
MIIPGFIDNSFNPPAPAIKAFILIEKLKVKGYIKFLIDTGASTTAILDRDRELLGIRIDELEKAPTRIGGIEGLVDTYVARDAKIILKTLNSEHVETLDVLMLKHDFSRLSDEEIKKVLAIPSLLGRDLIRKFKLTYSEAKEHVALEKD